MSTQTDYFPGSGATPQGLDYLKQQAETIERVYMRSAPAAVVASPPKGGKTVDALYTFPRALTIGRAGDLKSGFATVGFIPPDTETGCTTIDDLISATEKRIQRGRGGLRFVNARGESIYGVILDDYSRKALAQKDLLEPQIPKNHEGKPNHFWLWNEIGKRHNRLIKMLDELGQPVYLSCHPKDPTVDEKTKEPVPGHPEVASHAIGMNLAKDLHLVGYAIPDATRSLMGNRWGWGLHCCAQGGKWVAGDRHGVVVDGTPGYPATSPFNVAEILRFAGYPIPRAYGFDWAEEVVSQGFNMLLGGTPQHVMIRQLHEYLTGPNRPIPEIQPLMITWILRDIVDRFEIRTKSRKASPLTAWGINP